MFDGKFLGGAVIGSAGGYVCGARAGRERYERIVGPARRVGAEKISQVSAKGGRLLEAARAKVGPGGGGTKGGNSPEGVDEGALRAALLCAARSGGDSSLDMSGRYTAPSNDARARV